jgi:hypothetical protein
MGDIASDAAHLTGDGGTLGPNEFFHPLADELMAIAARLRDAANAPHDNDTAVQNRARPLRTGRDHLTSARRAYAVRRRRAAIFGNPDLFGEPAWDILLDLFIAHAEGKSVSVSSACIGSAVPATTGLRWLGVLADDGLVLRDNDPDDNRRVMVRLSDTGVAAMEQYFDAVEAGG